MLEIRTREDFEAFLTMAARGDRAIYYRGYLAAEQASKPVLRELNVAVNAAKENDQVVMLQKKLADYLYEYHVIRT
jgi:hypothetical protein